jgi:hypothetical protein
MTKVERTAAARIAAATTLGVLALMLSAPSDALAQNAWWRLGAGSTPTHLSPGSEGQITIAAANLGDTAANGTAEPITLNDVLPPGVTATAISGHVGVSLFGAAEAECSVATVSCTFTGTIAPYDQLEVTINVQVAPTAQPGEESEVTVSGGEAGSAASKRSLAITDAPTPFGIEEYEMLPTNEDGSVDTHAGSHPFQLTTTLSFNKRMEAGLPQPAVQSKDVHLNLPAGLVGNPTPFPQCTSVEFTQGANFVNRCPTDTAMGVVAATINLNLGGHQLVTAMVPVFNLTPRVGEPARFGFVVFGFPVVLDTSVRTGGDYGITVSASNITQTAGLLSSRVTIWGVPGDPRHNSSRGWPCSDLGFLTGEACGGAAAKHPPPFLTLPTSCMGMLRAPVTSDSWTQPGNFLGSLESSLPVAMSGCDRLPFTPAIDTILDSSAGSTPTGMTVDLRLPQESTLATDGLAEAHVKDTTVTLPEGLQLSPSSANGLEACSEAEVGFSGTDADGTNLFSPHLPQPFCPDAAKVGAVHIRTPLLDHELTGGVYLATQNVNPFGSLIALYIVAQDPASGVLVKLAGEVHLDEHSGRVVSTFRNTPQLPFEALKLEFFGGTRAPLSSPPLCGHYETKASVTPWSGNLPANPPSTFSITSGPNGSPCADPLPFAPSLTAGSTNLQGGAFTPFALTMSRDDGDQNLAGITMHMPQGLLGKLASVTPCHEPQASEGACGPESLIGHTVVTVGLGPDPYTISGGKVFITGPYKGAPYGLSVAEPAKAGPFDLGRGACDCIVVRTKIEIDPHTSALTIVSDPLPTILQGIPLQIKHANVTVDRPGFTFNPTNCSQLAISATIASEQGATAPVVVPFEVANCATLPFKPKFTALTQGKTSKANGASLHVKVTSGRGQANIGKVNVDLPKQLPSRLTTLQKACPDATFNANPASCPSGSVVGSATAVTPILKSPLTGPAYLVSHAARAFPDLVIVLQGEGIVLDLVGNTDIKKGVTISSFNSVPDAPVTSFDLVLPQGPHSALAAHGNLCTTTKTVTKPVSRRVHGRLVRSVKTVKQSVPATLAMPTMLTGQNGAVIRQTTRVAVSGCPKHKKPRKHHRHRKGNSKNRKR